MLLAAATPIHDLEEETQKLNDQKGNSEDKFMSPTEINNTICTMLLEQNLEVNLMDNSGQTPLMFVSRFGDQIYSKFILTSFKQACYNNNITLVKHLLEHKADVKTKRTTDHVTALHIALHEQNWDIADILLESGADINAENDEGVTPLHIAVAGTRQFLNKNYKISGFLTAVFLFQNKT